MFRKSEDVTSYFPSESCGLIVVSWYHHVVQLSVPRDQLFKVGHVEKMSLFDIGGTLLLFHQEQKKDEFFFRF